MDDKHRETIDPFIIDGFTDTLIPFFSWTLRQFTSAMFGCKLTLVLRNPTKAYKQRVMDSWGKGDQFSCEEILNFDKALVRRRCRLKLKQIMAPFFRELRGSPECIFMRDRFQEEWNRLAQTVKGIPLKIPPKVTLQVDIAKIEKKRDEEFCSYSSEDISATFPIGATLEDRVARHIKPEVDGYPETVRGLWWEAYRDWNVIRGVGIRKNSKIWEVLSLNPDGEPDMEGLINWSLAFALGQVSEDKLIYLSRWFMDRILVSQFILHPYSNKHFVSSVRPIGDDLTLEDTLADDSAQEVLYKIEDRDLLSSTLEELPAAQREACDLFLQTENTEELRRDLGDKKFKAVERNFQRAQKQLERLRKAGRLSL